MCGGGWYGARVEPSVGVEVLTRRGIFKVDAGSSLESGDSGGQMVVEASFSLPERG